MHVCLFILHCAFSLYPLKLSNFVPIFTTTVGDVSGMEDEPTEEAAEPVTPPKDLLNEDSCSSSDDEMVWFRLSG